MSETRECPKCGAHLPEDAPAGLCPKCLVQAGFESEGRTESQPEPTAPSPASSGFDPPSVEELTGRFPQLEILELLGKGGMGAVYKARQSGLDRLVAVKILPPEVGEDPAFAERFTREARALAKLNHPHIVAVHDSGQADDFYYFVMEYVEGVNLREMIRAGQLHPEEALAIIPQICEALQYAHNEGIVHRDIKPENILVDKKGRVKIADFGLAKLLGQSPGDVSLTGTQQVMGTLRYMAPEQMQGAGSVDHRADIYSLGVVFYEMLTGELPIGRFAAPSTKVQVDVRLDEIVLRALETEPEQRYQHVSEVKTEVELISGTSVSAAPPAAPPVETPPGRRSLWRRARLLVTLVVWTAVVVGVCLCLLPLMMNDWWPWAYNEQWEINLKPQSAAYARVRLSGERRLYCWGQSSDADRWISKRPWIATADIDVADTGPGTTLALDSFREQWRWTTPAGQVRRSGDELRPQSVAEWMKDSGIDISKPGVQEEAAALVELLKDAASGLLPENKRPRNYNTLGYGARIGPFTNEGNGGWGLHLVGMVGFSPDIPRAQMQFLCVIAAGSLAAWLPGIVIIVRRHRRRLATARETEHRYRLGTIGFWATLICCLGVLATFTPWVLLSSSSGLEKSLPGAFSNWYGTVSFLAFLTVVVLCFLTDFFSVCHAWQARAMIVGGSIVVIATSVLFWHLTGPSATVRVAERQVDNWSEKVMLVTTVGCWHECELARGQWSEGVVVHKTLEQRSGPGLWIASATGLAILVLGSVAMLWARRRPAEFSGPAGEKESGSLAAAPL